MCKKHLILIWIYVIIKFININISQIYIKFLLCRYIELNSLNYVQYRDNFVFYIIFLINTQQMLFPFIIENILIDNIL